MLESLISISFSCFSFLVPLKRLCVSTLFRLLLFCLIFALDQYRFSKITYAEAGTATSTLFSRSRNAIHIPAVMTMESVAKTQYRAAGP